MMMAITAVEDIAEGMGMVDLGMEGMEEGAAVATGVVDASAVVAEVVDMEATVEATVADMEEVDMAVEDTEVMMAGMVATEAEAMVVAEEVVAGMAGTEAEAMEGDMVATGAMAVGIVATEVVVTEAVGTEAMGADTVVTEVTSVFRKKSGDMTVPRGHAQLACRGVRNLHLLAD